MASSFKITRAIAGLVLSGRLAVAGKRGQFVSIKDQAQAVVGNFEDPLWELATGKKGYLLEREVLNATSIPLDTLIFQNDVLSPVLVGQQVSAREVLEGEFEGSDFLQLTGGNAIASTTAIGTPVTTFNGLLALNTGALIEKEALGSNGAGAVTLAGTQVGDVVLKATNLTTPADLTSSFESVITVAGQIQQSAATDLSAKQVLFLIQTPSKLQRTVGRVAAQLLPDDSGNTVRVLVEFNG